MKKKPKIFRAYCFNHWTFLRIVDILYSKIESMFIKLCWKEQLCFFLTKQQYTRKLSQYLWNNLFFPNAKYQLSILPIPIQISILCIIFLFLFIVLFVNIICILIFVHSQCFLIRPSPHKTFTDLERAF